MEVRVCDDEVVLTYYDMNKLKARLEYNTNMIETSRYDPDMLLTHIREKDVRY